MTETATDSTTRPSCARIGLRRGPDGHLHVRPIGDGKGTQEQSHAKGYKARLARSAIPHSSTRTVTESWVRRFVEQTITRLRSYCAF
jgi:hypothetical protein